MNLYQALALEQLPFMIQARQKIHMHPELSFREEATSAYVQQCLREMEIPFQACAEGHGVVARLKGTAGGKTIGFRADMDALPIQEDNDAPYRSRVDGVSHACGHDGHTAVLLGLAAALKRHPELLKGDVVLLFQPAEERLPGGAIGMVREGWADGLDSVFALHFQGITPTGTVLTMPGAIMAYSDSIEITITGLGGHAADPDLTHDALLAASTAVCALQNITSRFISPIENAVLSICSFLSGNRAFNVIQDRAELHGTVRCFSPAVRDTIEAKIHEVLQGVCAMFGTSYTLTYERGIPAVVNDAKMTALAVEAVAEAGCKAEICRPDLGGEDFAYFLQKVPGCFLYAGCGDKSKGIWAPVHTGNFDIDDDALAAALAVELAIYDKAASV